LQGDVVCAHGDAEHCDAEHVAGTGSMSPEEFDATVGDIVNFLYYVGEPIRETRQYIGFFVLGFLAILFVFTTLLNREYWKNIH
jgi:cytochrome c1